LPSCSVVLLGAGTVVGESGVRYRESCHDGNRVRVEPKIGLRPISMLLLVAAAGAVIPGAHALADLVFTSEPPTSAAVGRAYSYRMTAAIVSDDDRDGEDDKQDDLQDAKDDDGAEGDDRRLVYIARALPAWLEFDGNDTIFGTPRPEDVGTHRVKLRAKAKRDQVDQEFSIQVAPVPSGLPSADADLAASITVTPKTASVGESLGWRVTARNLADADVANMVLDTAFSGDAAFRLDGVDDSSCSIELRGDRASVVCRWSPLTSGSSLSARVSGRATGAGEILAVTRVSIVDAVPKDRNSANDEAVVVLRVTDGDSGSELDGDAPILTLNGASTLTVTVGEAFADPGATAVDDVDGDLTRAIVVDNPVDTTVIGRYGVTYEVVDSAGNMSTATRTVEIVPLPPAGGGGGGAVGVAWLLPLVYLVLLAGRPQRAFSPPRGKGQ
jgi:hypothetical protein